jgi:hypothetical protein
MSAIRDYARTRCVAVVVFAPAAWPMRDRATVIRPSPVGWKKTL